VVVQLVQRCSSQCGSVQMPQPAGPWHLSPSSGVSDVIVAGDRNSCWLPLWCAAWGSAHCQGIHQGREQLPWLDDVTTDGQTEVGTRDHVKLGSAPKPDNLWLGSGKMPNVLDVSSCLFSIKFGENQTITVWETLQIVLKCNAKESGKVILDPWFHFYFIVFSIVNNWSLFV